MGFFAVQGETKSPSGWYNPSEGLFGDPCMFYEILQAVWLEGL